MSLKNKKFVGGGFDGKVELLRVTYDFDNDGGAQGDYDVLEAQKDCVLRLRGLHVETTCAGATMVLDLGKGDGGTEFLSDTAVASLTAGAVIGADTAETNVKLASGEKIAMGIETADLTAGKFSMVFEVISF